MQRAPNEERRQHERYQAIGRAILRHGGKQYPTTIINISAGGVLLGAEHLAALGGQHVSVDIHLDSYHSSISVNGVVARADENEVAVKFWTPLPQMDVLAEWLTEQSRK